MNHRLFGELKPQYHPLHKPLATNKANELTQIEMLPRKNIRILTYNLFMRPPPIKTNKSDFKDDRLIEFVK